MCTKGSLRQFRWALSPPGLLFLLLIIYLLPALQAWYEVGSWLVLAWRSDTWYDFSLSLVLLLPRCLLLHLFTFFLWIFCFSRGLTRVLVTRLTNEEHLPREWQELHMSFVKRDLRTICRFSYMTVYKLITLGTKFKTLLSLGRKITMFSKFITNFIEQGWWHSSLTLKCMHLLLKEVNKRGRHAYNLHGWTCLPSGIVMVIHCHITGIFEAAVRLRLPSCCSV